MVYIKEGEPKKLSGLSSFFISFKYNADVVAAIKSSDKYIFDKKTYEWEVPLTSLAYLLDTITYIDDITLTLKKESGENLSISSAEFDLNPPSWLYELIELINSDN